MTDPHSAKLAQLQDLLESLEKLRPVLGDATVDAKKRDIEAQLRTLIQTGGGAVIAGAVDTGGGDFVGRDKNIYNIRIQAGAYVGERPRTHERALEIYRRVLAARTGDLPLRGFDPEASDATSARSDLSLAGVYVSLKTGLSAPEDSIERALTAARQGRPVAFPPRDPGRVRHGVEEREQRPVTAMEAAVLLRSQVLLGGPGSGKSTFVNYLANALATADPERLRDWPEAERDCLPVLILLRDFAAWIGAKGGRRKASTALLWDFVRHDLGERNLAFAAKPLEQALDGGRALVLLDGLDEVPAAALDRVRDSVLAFAGRYVGCRYLVTCRVLSYRQPQWRLPEQQFPQTELAPFDEGQVDTFVGAWYAEVSAKWQMPRAKAEAKADKLRQAVRRPDLWRLAPNPMLLTVMALVHTHEGELPDARARLYEKAVEILLWRWERQKQSGDPLLACLLAAAGRDRGDLLSLLERLAYEAHGRGEAAAGPDGERDEAVAGIGELDLLKALQPLHPKGSLDWAQQVLEALKLRAGLLVEGQPGVFSLPHRTFQEYLAGAYLARQGNFAERAAALVEGRAYWREAILLAAGYLVHNQRETERPLYLADRLCPPATPSGDAAWRRVWLAGDCLLEVGLGRVGDTDLGRRTLGQVRVRLAELLAQGRLEPRERAEAGDVLGRLGDPRFDPERLFLPNPIPGLEQQPLGLVLVPPGPFVMGSREGDKEAGDDEHGNPPSLAIAYPYWIGPYPVTVAQYGCFCQAGGYEDRQWWTVAGWDWRTGRYDTRADDWLKDWLAQRPPERRGLPFQWGEQSAYGNRPVTGVCWFEAMAYVRWLDAQLRPQAQDIPTGYLLRLATEAEWEKAARGTEGRVYAWGDPWDPKRANVGGAIGRPSAVGMYPAGATPGGVLDLTGNVWEWCLSLHKGYPYRPDDGRNDPDGEGGRVVRGGSWDYAARDARCAYRLRCRPDYFDDALGFRVVLSLADSGF